jgi:hypothetical protein
MISGSRKPLQPHSGAGHSLGKGEVESSILSCSTMFLRIFQSSLGEGALTPILQPNRSRESHARSGKIRKWSGRRESNPRMKLGKLPFYH